MKTQSLQDQLDELSDVCNELCLALDTALIGADRTKFNHVAKMILRRREDVRPVLAKHNYLGIRISWLIQQNQAYMQGGMKPYFEVDLFGFWRIVQ